MRLDFSPLDTNYATLHVRVPFDHNSSPLEHALLQQEQGKHKTTKKQSYFFFFNSEMKKKKNLLYNTKKTEKGKFTRTCDEDYKCYLCCHLHLGTIPGNSAI